MAEEHQAQSDGVLHGNISGKQMTMIGLVFTAIQNAFQAVQIGLTDDVPLWIRLLIGAICAAATSVTAYMGLTHPGTGTKRS